MQAATILIYQPEIMATKNQNRLIHLYLFQIKLHANILLLTKIIAEISYNSANRLYSFTIQSAPFLHLSDTLQFRLLKYLRNIWQTN